MEKKRKTVQIPDEVEREVYPLAVFVGDEDDDVEADLRKLLGAHGYSAPPRRFWQRVWPPWP